MIKWALNGAINTILFESFSDSISVLLPGNCHRSIPTSLFMAIDVKSGLGFPLIHLEPLIRLLTYVIEARGGI
jgi:hypothetical protein